MSRPWTLPAAAALALALAAPLAADAQQPAGPAGGPPHAWLFGTWTGGIFPASETGGAACFGQPSVIFTRDIVMRSSPVDVAMRQRLVQTATATPQGVEFRLVPAAPPGGRVPLGAGFGCADPNLLRVERRGNNEIVFPDCSEFPSPLKRCTTP